MNARPTFAIKCNGTAAKPHDEVLVAVHTRFAPDKGEEHGFWAPTYSGITPKGESLVLPTDKVDAESNQFTWPCPHRGCSYRFRHPHSRVNAVLDRLHAAGEHEATLRFIDAALQRHTGKAT